MWTLLACAACFLIGRYGSGIAAVIKGLWIMKFDPERFERITAASDEIDNKQELLEAALMAARARLAHIYEQAQNLEMAKKLAHKGVKEIDETRSKL